MLHELELPAPRGLEDLKFAEQFVVWALRAWVHNSQRPDETPVDLETGFRLAKVEPAHASLSFFMRVLQRASLRPIEVRCLHCTAVSPDEELMLHAVASLQAGRHIGAQIVLHRYLPCAGVRLTMWSLEAFAERLRTAGLNLQLNDAGQRHVEAMAADAVLPSVAIH